MHVKKVWLSLVLIMLISFMVAGAPSQDNTDYYYDGTNYIYDDGGATCLNGSTPSDGDALSTCGYGTGTSEYDNAYDSGTDGLSILTNSATSETNTILTANNASFSGTLYWSTYIPTADLNGQGASGFQIKQDDDSTYLYVYKYENSDATNWYCQYNAGSGCDTPVAITADTWHDFMLNISSSNLYLYVDGTLMHDMAWDNSIGQITLINHLVGSSHSAWYDDMRLCVNGTCEEIVESVSFVEPTPPSGAINNTNVILNMSGTGTLTLWVANTTAFTDTHKVLDAVSFGTPAYDANVTNITTTYGTQAGSVANVTALDSSYVQINEEASTNALLSQFDIDGFSAPENGVLAMNARYSFNGGNINVQAYNHITDAYESVGTLPYSASHQWTNISLDVEYIAQDAHIRLVQNQSGAPSRYVSIDYMLIHQDAQTGHTEYVTNFTEDGLYFYKAGVVGSNTSTRNITIDTQDPVVTGVQNADVTTNTTFTRTVTATDDNLYSVNMTCSPALFSGYENVSIIPQTSASFLINITLNETMVCAYEVCDAHTKRDITNQVDIIANSTTQQRVDVRWDGTSTHTVEIAPGSANARIQPVLKKDRVQFIIRPDQQGIDQTIILHYTASDDMQYFSASPYPGHVIVPSTKTWFDMVGANNLRVYRLNSDTIEFRFDARGVTLLKSTGKLNCVSGSMTITAVDPVIADGVLDFIQPYTCNTNSVQDVLLLAFIFLMLCALLWVSKTWLKVAIGHILVYVGFIVYGVSLIGCWQLLGVLVIVFASIMILYEGMNA